MTPQEVGARIAELSTHAQSDPERFHGMRDKLYLDVLRTLADAPCDAGDLASAALEAERVVPAWEACA